MALILAISVTTASAQDPTDACLRCIISSAMIASPTCDYALLSTEPPSGELTPEQKACYCPLSVSDTWVQRCVQPGECLASDAPIIYATVSGLKQICTAAPQPWNGRFAPTVLEGVATIALSDAGTLMGSFSKVFTGVSLAVALAVVLLV
ncbi:hypothetical protein BGZ97_013033 [Linnemannia gamsii]|uniref:Uncharacterized protein n=1 Tax=Linnemannia gamsii TaxID=64522 RepID=A0A9P6QZS8_9FUNG|nr:hypothetical protein BGZ97_013033 [Linnemannia gamsii]